MANPRRSSSQFQQSQNQNPTIPLADQTHQPLSLSSISLFLKRPRAFPILLSVFVLLTWIFLRLQRSAPHFPPLHTRSAHADAEANLVRFSAVEAPSLIAKDQRGWLLDPIDVAREAGISGGALSCASLHVGEIRSGGLRGNHRHHNCNETFVIWGADMKFRLENPNLEGKGYAEVFIGADEVAVAASAAGTAHALINVDGAHSTFFLGCQDRATDYNKSANDFNVWEDL